MFIRLLLQDFVWNCLRLLFWVYVRLFLSNFELPSPFLLFGLRTSFQLFPDSLKTLKICQPCSKLQPYKYKHCTMYFWQKAAINWIVNPHWFSIKYCHDTNIFNSCKLANTCNINTSEHSLLDFSISFLFIMQFYSEYLFESFRIKESDFSAKHL